MKFLRCFLPAMLMPLAIAHAALITEDSQLGANTVVLDTGSGLEWVKLSVTGNRSVNQVYPELSPGHSLESFHYATTGEFQCLLFERAGPGCGSSGALSNFDATQAFLATFGLRIPAGDGITSFYQVDPPGGTGVRQTFVASFTHYVEPVPNYYFDSQQISLTRQTPDTPAYHWLVRPAEGVPEPSTIALLAAGMPGLARMRKKK